MAEFFKHEIAKWNVATDDLTLEQEAAYHRVVATIRLYERPFRHNLRVLSGLWRCNERRAKRLLEELVFAGKLTIEDGFIIDEKAVDDASTLRQSRVDKASAGRLGGIESGKARRKPLENNDTDEAPASTREEKAREEKAREEEEDGGDGSAQGEILPDVQPVQNPTDREQILAAIGVDPISGLTGRGGQMIGNPADMVCARSWINDLGLTMPEIIEVIRDTMAKKTTGPPSVFKYFNESMQRLAAAKSAPALKPSEGNYDSRPANISSPAKSRPGDGSGTIAALAAVAAKYAGRTQ